AICLLFRRWSLRGSRFCGLRGGLACRCGGGLGHGGGGCRGGLRRSRLGGRRRLRPRRRGLGDVGAGRLRRGGRGHRSSGRARSGRWCGRASLRSGRSRVSTGRVLVHIELCGLGGDEQVAHEQEDHCGDDYQGHQDDECLDDAAEHMEDAVAPVKVAHVYSSISFPVWACLTTVPMATAKVHAQPTHIRIKRQSRGPCLVALTTVPAPNSALMMVPLNRNFLMIPLDRAVQDSCQRYPPARSADENWGMSVKSP